MLKRVGEETELIQCPYDVSHLIIRHRFQVHLVRCRKSYPNAEVVVCPFDITHRINKQELEWHVKTCPGRQSYELFKSCEAPVSGLSCTANKSFCADSTKLSSLAVRLPEIELSENWDEENDVPAYNPKEYVEKNNVLRLPVGLPPAQRNAFRAAEHKRLNSITKY